MASLTKMVLSGFKSFARKTEIPFYDGITGIVGPNGCGKSNVSDAVRWVLGENASSVMRADTMIDVIFKGSEGSKNARNSAEVALYFDNSDGALHAEKGEVIVSRRVISNGETGESDYFINGIPCKRKEVAALMKDTGVGQGGYAIIGQGSVTQIVEAKPEKRLEIFEDAACIKDNKKEKQDVEKKLLDIDREIETLTKIVAEKSKALEPIIAQRENLIKWREYDNELKTTLANCYVVTYKSAEQKKKEHHEVVTACNELLNDRSDTINKYESEKAILNNSIIRDENRIRAILEQIGELRVNAEKADSSAVIFKQEQERLSGDRNRLISAILDIETENSELEIKLKEANLALNDKKDCFDRTNALYHEVSLKLMDVNKSLNALNQEESKSTDRLVNAMSEMTTLEKERSRLQEKLNTLARDISDSEEAIIRIEVERKENEKLINAQLERKAEIDKSRATQGPAFQELNQKVALYSSALSEAERLESELKTKISVMESQLLHMDESVIRLNSARAKSPRVNKAIIGLFADIIKYDSKYEQAILSSLGKVMQNFVVNSDADAIDMVHYLDENQIGRCTFLPLNKVKGYALDDRYRYVLNMDGCIGVASELISFEDKYYFLVNRFLGRVLIVRDMESGYKIQSENPNTYKLVTLNGEVIEAHGALTGGKKGGNDSQDRAMLERLRAAHTKQINKVAEIKASLAKYQQDIEKLRDSSLKYSNELAAITVQIDNKTQAISKAKGQITLLNGQIDSKTKEKEEVDRQLLELDFQSQDMAGKRHQEDEMLRKAQGNATMLQELSDKLSELKIKLAAKTAKLSEEIKHIMSDIATFMARQQSLMETLAEKKSSLATKDNELQELLQNAPSVNLSKEDRKRCEDLDKEQKGLRESNDQKRVRIEYLEEEIKRINDEIFQLNNKKIRAEEKLKGVDADVEKYANLVYESYGLTIEGCLLLEVEQFTITEGERRIKSLKSRISTLGNINFTADIDYERNKAEFDKMNMELEDDTKARNDIVALLSEITKKMNNKFYTRFNLINEYFGEIFRELFNGGSAELIVEVDRKDGSPLGVDITMCPPGKAKQNLSHFSGGEKSLTAIAILFAIVKTTPTPFCLLDETDAALDDANAIKYSRYMRKLSQDTQFIVITHKKPTMECADRLYGISMPGDGITNLYVIELADALKIVDNEDND